MKNLPRNRLAAAIALAWLAAATTAVQAQVIDLGNLGSGGFRIDGIDQIDFSGTSVSGAGDVNGDGLADLIVGAPGSDSRAGESYVVFGKASPMQVDLALLGSGGFRIDGIDVDDASGFSVSGAGDVNGDGLADLIVGANRADPRVVNEGESYVVFGKTNSTPVDLAAIGAGGFRIDGINRYDRVGWSVSGAGDVNGDGLADLIVGAIGADSSAGESYVVFGKNSATPVDLAALGNGGFRINGIDPNDYSGFSVSGAGDVNGDGLTDIIVGAYKADPSNGIDAGESYVVFGKTGATPVDLAALGSGGFRIDGGDANDSSGRSVSGAGDVNGDGLADLIVGASQAAPGGNFRAGKSYVVFGKANATLVNLASLGIGGFRMDGIDARDLSGRSVSGAGDVNGDGLSDLIVGAEGGDPGGDSYAGESYLVFGKTSAAAVDLAVLGNGGFRIDGNDAGDNSGSSVSGAGDVNGDGLADLVIGALGAAPGGDTSAGESYIIFSPSIPPLESSYRARSANGNPPRSAVGIVGDGSNDSHPDSRLWIDFANGSDPLGSASTETVTLTRSRGNRSQAAATVQWRIQTTRQNWTSAEVRFRYLDSELRLANENALQILFSPTGMEPFKPLASVVNPLNNTISTNINQPGFFYLGQGTPNPVVADALPHLEKR